MENIKELIEKYKHKTILYVEDEDFIREQMTKVLSRLFDNVTTAVDGEDALSKYSAGKFDLVLTDIQMPNMDGVELIKNVVNISKEQKIVVLTAFNQNNELKDLIDMGVKKVVTKPVSLTELFNTFSHVFE